MAGASNVGSPSCRSRMRPQWSTFRESTDRLPKGRLPRLVYPALRDPGPLPRGKTAVS